MAGARMSHELGLCVSGRMGDRKGRGEMQRPGGGGTWGPDSLSDEGGIVRTELISGLVAGLAQRGGGEGQGLDMPSGSVGVRVLACWSLALRLDSAPPFLLLTPVDTVKTKRSTFRGAHRDF